jgi:predicted amidohydrolase
MSRNVNVRAAVVQAATTVFDSVGAVGLVERWAAQAAAEGVQLAVFPEAFVGGYPKGSTFGAVVGARTDAGREEFGRYFDAAVTVPGTACTWWWASSSATAERCTARWSSWPLTGPCWASGAS